MRILMTGATGLIGRELGKALAGPRRRARLPRARRERGATTAASTKGTGFLADVVRAREAELRTQAEQRPQVRVPIVRTGIVLARRGGALAEMLPMFRLAAAGQLGLLLRRDEPALLCR